MTNAQRLNEQLKDIATKLQIDDLQLTKWNPGDGWTRYQLSGYYKGEYLPKEQFTTDYMTKKELDAFISATLAMTRFNKSLVAEDKKHLTIIGRRWFEKVNGNTYHSVNVWINGQCVGGVDYEYGYGDQYLQTAQDILEKLGYPSETYPNGNKAYGRPYFEKHFTSWIANVSNVERKKDL
jgi:hypothetical protein